MSYVPPHLRNSIANSTCRTSLSNPTSTTTTTSVHHRYSHNGEGKIRSYDGKNYSSATPSDCGRRSSGHILPSNPISVPETVLPQWKPSERVFRFKPEQVPQFLFSLLRLSAFSVFPYTSRNLLLVVGRLNLSFFTNLKST